MKKLIAFALVLVMIVPLMVFSVSADTISPDTSWYDAGKSEFTITTAAQLYGLSSLTQGGNNFSGKTVKLGADITVNEGDASTWATNAPTYSWNPIRGFAGTFDGQGHTVSGLYCNGISQPAMFGAVSTGAVITDFKLINSYFKTLDHFGGGVIFQAQSCTVSYIYSDAIVEVGNVSGFMHAGGIVGLCNGGDVTVEYCWFDGSVTIGGRYAAGILGNGNGNDVYIRHCLNTGSIYSTQNIEANSHIAGIMGRNDAKTVIEDCLNVGKISSAYQDAGNEDVFGSLVGSCAQNFKNADGTWKSHISITNSWASAESCYRVVGNNSSQDPEQIKDYKAIPEALLKGYNGYLNTTLDFENVWAVNMEGTPVLQYFADEIPHLYDVNIPEISNTEVKVEGHYGPRWELTVKVPEGMKKEDVKVGMLIVPTKAIPAGQDVTLLDTSFTYRDNEYEVANVEGAILRESDDSTIVATFVVTDLTAVNARMGFTAVPYAVYQVEEGALEIYGLPEKITFYKEAVLSLEDASMDDATRYYTEQVLAPIDAELGGRFPVAADWSEMDLFEEIPAMVADDTVILPAEDKGLGNYVITVDGTLDSNYFDYLEVMETFGFEKIYDNSNDELNANADAVYTTTYKKGDDLFVTVTDLGYNNQCFISAIRELELSEHLYDNFKSDVIAGKKTTLAMMELINFGTGIVVQLKNGHFLIWDGGLPAASTQPGDLINTLEYMESLVPAGEKPVVEAWFVSHYHADHIYLLRDFVDNPSWCNRIYLEGFYSSMPSDAVKELDTGVYREIDYELQAISMLKSTSGKTPVQYRVQTGQTYYFSDMSVDIMMTQEQLLLADYNRDDNGALDSANGPGFNDSSTWYQINIEGQNVLFAGDSAPGGQRLITRSYERSYLDFDLFFALHHGVNSRKAFNDAITVHTVVWPSRQSVHWTYWDNAQLREMSEDELINYLGGTVVFTFPFEPGYHDYTVLPPRAR